MKDLESCAAALYDGGWHSVDFSDLMTEYDLTDTDAEAICEILASIEEENRWRAI